MSRARFGILLALLVAAVATSSFLAVLALLDDDLLPGVSTTTTAASDTTAPPGGVLPSPSFVAIVVSEPDVASAGAAADELTERGFDSGVLRSDDYSSLEPGFWVAYIGPFQSVAEADAASEQLKADGYPAAYPRCVGETDDCG